MQKADIRIRMGIRWKLMLAMASMIVLVVVSLTVIQVDAQRRNLIRALSTHSNFLKEDMIRRADRAANHMVTHIQAGVVSFDYHEMQAFIRDAVDDVVDLEYVVLMRSATPVIAYGQDMDSEVRRKILSGKASAYAEEQMQTVRYDFAVGEHAFMETIVPIYLNKKVKWGSLRLGFSRDSLNSTLQESQRYIDEQIDAMVVRSIFTALLFLLLGTAAVFVLSNRWTRTIHPESDIDL